MGDRPLLMFVPTPELLRRQALRADEIEEVSSLLLEHADPGVGSGADRAEVAGIVALACLGDDHLWQDLQLASRVELGVLLRRWFPALAAKNTGDMKWKKFFYKQLCERAEIHACRAPSCAVCSDHAACFGPEE
ncbi:nitrogen fixation protein NifQ [Sphaerotilus uruguayifluvii]|uniref:Nitrogen fixation protein NifQ n=1 Tax=Sphaerotilus uruguayifluvii TaxID=2735897 RepID=A0ABX2G9G4_9BURK|nr:nitrogen fixation protein NifQ [Leptothrix sp. C29]NRT58446.1 nitrogen fixation protein NifQ [Leptothrix sp. C29]